MTTQQQDQTIEHTTPSSEFGKAGFSPAAHADDDDLAALEAALAKGDSEPSEAAEAEPETDATETEVADDQTETPEATQPATQPAKAADGKPRMVPIERLNEVISERNKTREEIAELRGMVAALAASKGAQATPAAAQDAEPETPQSRIEKMEAEVAALAERYDNGGISFSDYEKARRAIDRQIVRLELEIDQPRTTDRPDDTYLREQTDRLESDFPVLKSLTAADIQAIVPLAQRQAEKDGIDFGGNALRFRRYVAETAQRIYGDPTQQTTTTPAAGAQAQDGNPKPGNAAARKVELARNAPPNLNNLSVSGRATQVGEYTPQRVAAMSDDELAALPDSVLAKLAGGR